MQIFDITNSGKKSSGIENVSVFLSSHKHFKNLIIAVVA